MEETKLEHQAESSFRIIEIDAGNPGKLLEAVPERVDVDVNQGRSSRNVAERVEPGSKGVHEVDVVSAVVLTQYRERTRCGLVLVRQGVGEAQK